MTIERDAGVCARYARDVSIIHGQPDAVLRPRDVQDIQDAVAEAASTATAVLPVGSQTSTTGASVATHGGLIIDMAQIDGSRATPHMTVDRERQVVDVDPGIRLQILQEELLHHGFELPVDPTSAATCTVGGAVATNASGPSTFRHGPMARWVHGLAFVDGLGALHQVRRSRVSKSAMGPPALQDPVQWMVGSEGTLGVMTRVTLRIRPRPSAMTGVWVGVESTQALADVVVGLGRRFGPSAKESMTGNDARLRAIEWLDPACCQMLAAHAKGMQIPDGQGGGLWLLVEGDPDANLNLLDQVLTWASPIGVHVSSAQIMTSPQQRRDFDALRHRVPDTLNRRGRALERAAGGGKLSTDWSAPVQALPALFDQDNQVFEGLDGVRLYRFGHIGDGHPHLNVMCPDAATRAAALLRLKAQLRRVVAAGGVPVSEHGIGKLKREMVAPYLPAGTVAAWRGLKARFDPVGVLAPGNLFTS